MTKRRALSAVLPREIFENEWLLMAASEESEIAVMKLNFSQ